MKVYRQVSKMMTAEAPDGAVCLDIGATHGHEPEIVEVDYDAKTFRRFGQDLQPFPEKWYLADDLQWMEVSK